MQGRAKHPIASRGHGIRQMFNIDATSVIVVSCRTWLRAAAFLNTNVSFHQKRNPDLHSNVRILCTTISILRTERVGSKPLSLPPSRPFSRFILMEEEQVWINSVHHGKYLRSKIPPFDVSPKEKYRSPETKRSRINARLKCRFVFRWLLVLSSGCVWKIVEDVLEILQTNIELLN